jgi:hypothetical protein
MMRDTPRQSPRQATSGRGSCVLWRLLIAATIFLGAAECRADGVAVGAQYPLSLPKPDHICVVVVVGYSMNDWFVRDIVKQTQEIAAKYGEDVGVQLAFTPGDNIEEYYKNTTAPVLAFPVVHLNQSEERMLGIDGTPMMYIMDSERVIQKIQDGWTGVSMKKVQNKKPWLVNSASQCIDGLEGNHMPAPGGAASPAGGALPSLGGPY